MENELPEGIHEASMKNHIVMQVTEDIEQAIAEMERGDTLTLSEFKEMFVSWKDIK